jgi:Na+(H+)/acetate symporter ActP
VPAIGLVGRIWGDHLAKWFYVPVYLLVVAGYAVVTGNIGGFVVGLLIAVPLAVVLAQVVGLAMAFRWAATVRQEHIMRRWR